MARGGLRWSDRREDFRTEILGLVKAQAVKNAVIVPVGAKGGFIVKSSKADPANREAVQAEGIECYRTFISALLDITDNLVDGEVVPPQRVVRHDGDDPYLVVAADKGTATFSDIANDVSQAATGSGSATRSRPAGRPATTTRRWASPRVGAWESVKRHFRELGIDTQTQDFSVRRRRRHVRRRVRQRDAAVGAHPAGRRLRPPAHLPRPQARPGAASFAERAGCSPCPGRRGTTTTTR